MKPGDLLHADANGIVNIPHEIAAAVAEPCEHYIQAEEIILQYAKFPANNAGIWRDCAESQALHG